MKEIIKAEFNEIYVVNETDSERLKKTEVEINALTLQANQMALTYVIAIGSKLKEAKEMVNHGQWGNWCNEKINYSQSTAENYIKIYEEYGSEQLSLLHSANSETIMNLPYSKALALIAIPAEEREDFVKENDIENVSVRELKEIIKKKEDEEGNYKNRITELEADKEKISKEISKKEEQIKKLEEDLKNIPENSVPQSELEKIRNEIEAEKKKEYSEKIKKHKEEISQLQEELDEIKTGKAAAEDKVKELQNIVENAGVLQIVNAYFEGFQEAFIKLKNELDKVKEENLDDYVKIAKGIIKMLDNASIAFENELETMGVKLQ